jgi:hypothetical protein
MIGRHLESIVRQELRAQGFNIIALNARKYKEREWQKTDHNLDIIAEHQSGKLAIGAEIKNTLDIIEPAEIDVKIDICEYLGLIPVFAVRWIKPYIECIRKQGGFSWVFKTQIYPFGQEEFTEMLFRKLSALNKKNSRNRSLQFPVSVRGDIPDKSKVKFKEWIDKCLIKLPVVDTSYRCRKSSQQRSRDEPPYDESGT